MAMSFPRRAVPFAGAVESWLCRSLCSRASTSLDEQIGKLEPDTPCERHRKGQQPSMGTHINLSPLLSASTPPPGGYSIEVVDAETWRVSAGLSLAWHGNPGNSGVGNFAKSVEETGMDGDPSSIEGGIPDADFDGIDDMRIRGNLFYKLEKASKEFEEYTFDFHRKKSSKRREGPEEVKEKEKPNRDSPSKQEKLQNVTKKSTTREESPAYSLYESSVLGNVNEVEKKKLRVPTFNELTGPYHEPFCLDIFISNASVRACIVHRVTSNVVVVAHSISKDMKFDLSSTRNARACEAVGEVLAQRALADDIHDVVYTPRRGEVLEGKLGVVVRAIIENGVRVKLKLKQRRQKGGNTHRSLSGH